MSRLTHNSLKNLIIKELKNLVDEDFLVIPGTGKDQYYDEPDELNYDDNCPECGHDHHVKSDCPAMSGSELNAILEACGCGGSPEPIESQEYEVDWKHPDYGHAQVEDISALDHDEASDMGKAMGQSGDFGEDAVDSITSPNIDSIIDQILDRLCSPK